METKINECLKNKVPSLRELKEQRLKELLNQFEEICLMTDDDWNEYERENE